MQPITGLGLHPIGRLHALWRQHIMDISVIVEKVADNGYQATSYVPAHVVAQGRTRQEALDRLCDQLRSRLSSAEVMTLSIPQLSDAHPWKAIAGSWRESPDRAAIERNLQEYRQQVDADPDRL
jgi:predicted RNase H-like HicB family nuclease